MLTERKVKVPEREPYLSNQVTEDELAYAIMLDRAECFNDGELEDRSLDDGKSYVVEELNQAVYSDEWLQRCFDAILNDDPEEVVEKERYIIERILEARKLGMTLAVELKIWPTVLIEQQNQADMRYNERYGHYKDWLIKTFKQLIELDKSSLISNSEQFDLMIRKLGLYDLRSNLYKEYVIDNLK